jgi:HAMP domain-containing protein
LLPYDPLLTQEITLNQKGFAYAELSDAFLIQIVGATIAWLGAWSVDRALLRTSRAEEVAEARKRLNEQAQQIVAQKHRLDYGMSMLKEAQARFANGDYTARVKLQDNELTPLALSFNLLAERLYRITQIAQEYTRLEQALQQLFEIQNNALLWWPFKVWWTIEALLSHRHPCRPPVFQFPTV